MNGPRDSWQTDAGKRLARFVFEASKRDRDYAPDSKYDGAKRVVVDGPHTIAIGKILVQWASMWAQDMRELERFNGEKPDAAEQANAWTVAMTNADAEVDRYVANNRLVRAA